MEPAQDSAVRLLKLAMLGAVVLPAALFVYMAWTNHRHMLAVADDRIDRTVTILQEHALKVFETIDRSSSETNEIVRDMSDAEIRANGEHLHQRLGQLVKALPQFKSIWLFDRDGQTLVNSRVHPPPQLGFTDREYFSAHVAADSGAYVGEVLWPRAPYPDAEFFSVSRRRPDVNGNFSGVIQLAILPDYFERFYTRIQQTAPGNYAALVRADGAVLARYPALSENTVLPAGSALLREMQQNPVGLITAPETGPDDPERRLAYRKLSGWPVYVVAGTETAAVRQEWLWGLAGHLVFGIPATLMLFFVLAMALSRTRKLYRESARRVAAEVALRKAQRMEVIGQLTGGVAHDFNNLLMVVKGNTQRLQRQLDGTEYMRHLDMIEQAAQRGEGLTRQLLSFARQQNLTLTVLDLCARVRDVQSVLRPSLRGDIEITVDMPSEVCPVRVDSGELELTLLNLAVNARDAMPDGGTLAFAIRPVTLDGDAAVDRLAGPFIALSVIDSGSGIPEEIRQRIFEPFFTTKDVGKGTGLGLSQVYGFAKQSGGTVTVDSAPGQGSIFTIYLPRSEQLPDKACETRDTPPRERGSGMVLVVEDDAEVADVAISLLRELGYDARMVPAAQAALNTLETERDIDIVFSDVLMPGGMSGIELAAVIRRKWPTLPVVLTTGYQGAMPGELPEGVPVLQKPYDLAELQRVLRAALVGRKATVTS